MAVCVSHTGFRAFNMSSVLFTSQKCPPELMHTGKYHEMTELFGTFQKQGTIRCSVSVLKHKSHGSHVFIK